MTDLQALWHSRLTQEAAGLDFTDSEDRVTFRLRVQDALRLAKMAVMQEVLVGPRGSTSKLPRSRSGIIRMVADTFIQQKA